MFQFVITILSLASIGRTLAASFHGGQHNLPHIDGRIVGGTLANISSFPWQISLQRNGAHSCGGAIYSEEIIITAAHCLQAVSPSILRIRAGSSFWNSGGTLVAVSDYIAHKEYSSDNMGSDIAVLRLVTPLEFSDTIQPISLATISPPNGAAAVVTGWGATSFGAFLLPSQLMKVNVNIVDRGQCSSNTYGYGNEIKSTMLCASGVGKDACQGDSGGPLVSGGKLVGVVSWGYGCAYPNYPGVYSDVAELHPWLMENIDKLVNRS